MKTSAILFGIAGALFCLAGLIQPNPVVAGLDFIAGIGELIFATFLLSRDN